jgi:tetrapyrrole methylase family protein/MazG family protein
MDNVEAEKKAGEAFAGLYRIIARLRAPDGCPWDREQTPLSLRGDLIEEAYELVEAIVEGDPDHVREESGDLVLVAAMICYMFEEEGRFTVAQCLEEIQAKLIRRHPHVFGEAMAASSAEVLEQWAQIKEKVEGRRKKDSLLDAVSQALPTLERAYKLQKKAAKVGFDWPESGGAWAKAREELAEAELEARAIQAGGGDPEAKKGLLEAELGDLLFSVVNLSRKEGIDPGLALARANDKFTRRFRHVEKRMAETGQKMEAGALEAMDGFWNEAKASEKETQ